MLRIRPTSPGDVDFLWSMLFYAAHADEQPGASIESIRLDPELDRYLSDWGRAGDLGLVAADDDASIGAAWLRLFTRHETHLVTYVEPEVPELVLAVEPTRIGEGVGSLLLSALLDEADGVGIPAVVLSARADNPAVRLYERHGFVETDRIVNRVGSTSVKMVRERPR